jgi:hypothetical protein
MRAVGNVEGQGEQLEGSPHVSNPSSTTLVGDHVESSAQRCSDDEINIDQEDEDDENEEERLELEARAKKPWYRRPSSWWYGRVTVIVSYDDTDHQAPFRVVGLALPVTVIVSATLAPRIDVYTSLACEALKVQRTTTSTEGVLEWKWPKLPPPPKSCGQDPEVQAAVASLSTRK